MHEHLNEAEQQPLIEALDNMRKELGFLSVWSVDGINPFDMAGQHPYRGVSRLVYVLYDNPEADAHCQIVVPISGTSWLDLWRASEAAVVQSGDHNHRYIELFRQIGGDTLLLHTGS